MDMDTIGIAIAVAKGIPGSATQEATAAADRAEAAAASVEEAASDIAAMKGHTIFFDDNGMFYVNT